MYAPLSRSTAAEVRQLYVHQPPPAAAAPQEALVHARRVLDLLVCEDLLQRLADEGRLTPVRDTRAVTREHEGVEVLVRVEYEARCRQSRRRGGSAAAATGRAAAAVRARREQRPGWLR